MLLVYTRKITPRISYVFKHIFTRILGTEITFTSIIEEFIAHNGPKLSYGKKPMGNEMFIQSHGLLNQQGFESSEITVKEWDDTKCFFQTSDLSTVPFDIFSAAFYLLSRYEEYLPHVKDEMGRFPYTESLAYSSGFLKEPIVDIWAYKFKHILLGYFPDLNFEPRKFKEHYLINSSQPYKYIQKGVVRTMIGFLTDLAKFRFKNIIRRFSVILRFNPDPNNTFNWIIESTKASNVQLTMFFRMGNAIMFNESINTHRQRFKLLVKYVADYHKIGLIFSLDALGKYERMKKEKLQLENIINRSLPASINERFIVNLPEMYRNLVELEVYNDYTMLYQKTSGFRAGTCTPFLFYDLDYEIKTPLVVHPVATTTTALTADDTVDIKTELNDLKARVENIGGVFSIFFKNTDFTENPENEIWRNLLNKKQ